MASLRFFGISLCALGAIHLLLVFPSAAQTFGEEIPPTSSAQIKQLQDFKDALSSTQRKISTDILLAIPDQQQSQAQKNLLKSVPTLRRETKSSFTLDVQGTINEEVLEKIRNAGGNIVSASPQNGIARVRAPSYSILRIAGIEEVRSIRAPDRRIRNNFNLFNTVIRNKFNETQGDIAHAAKVARRDYNVDGTGVTACALSDGVWFLGHVQATGDLPQIQILPGQSGSTDPKLNTGEGTAMLEIIHDLAPGAQLMFATADETPWDFAKNILDLRSAGCHVLVDDIAYLFTPVFQDGVIAQAVADVVASGAQYFSSATNSGNLNDNESGVWEGDFSPGSTPQILQGKGEIHAFLPGSISNRLLKNGDDAIILQWSDPWGKSSNDYDLYLLDPTLQNVIIQADTVQSGAEDPIEYIDTKDKNYQDYRIVIMKKSGAQARYLHLNTHRGRLEIGTEGQIFGHPTVDGAFSVAAVDVSTANSSAFTGGSPNPVERYSSDGPRRVFFDRNGTPITPNNFSSSGGSVRRKVDISAADGVATAACGFNPFYGTSAAAPHAAAIGVLALSLKPNLTPSELASIFKSTALDIEASGWDRDSGHGIVMADRVLAETKRIKDEENAKQSTNNTASSIIRTTQ